MTRRVKDLIFTKEDRRVIDEACSRWDDGHKLIDLRSGELEISSALEAKLRAYGCVATGSRKMWVLNEKTLLLKEELDQPVDYWESITSWFKTKWWSLPVAFIVLVVPAIWGYIEIVLKILSYLSTGR